IQSAGMIFRSNPILGVGADCFAERYPQYMKRVKFASQYVHNQYLQFAAETGIIGLVFFLIFVLFSLFAPISYNDKLLGLFIFQAMLFFSLHIFFDIDWYITVLPLIFTTYIAILDNKSSSKISSVIITIVAFIVIFYFVARSMGESLYNSARSDFIKGDAERSIKELKKAIYFAPLKSEIYEGIGDYYLACGDYSRGIDMYKRASKFAKLSPNPHIRLARFFVTTGAPDSAIFHYRKAISLSRSLNLNYYNELGRYLLGLGKTGEAKELFDTVANVYRWGVDWGYNERTVAHRYYVADALFELAKLERDSTKVKSFIARAESLGAPREYDFIARTFGDNFIAPEKVVKDFYDAWSDGNIALASSFLTDSSYKLVPMENKEIRVSRILDVSYDYWAGIADVVYLARLVENNSEKNIRGRFRLYRQENGWKIEPAY
ncbi:MAG: O-antigen ligase family protein, partial [bacterium]